MPMPRSGGFLRPRQQARLAEMIDARINIPIVGDEAEADIFLKIVRIIDGVLEEELPDELLATMTRSDLQIEEWIADALRENLQPLLEDRVSLPFLPAFVKTMILQTAVEAVVSAMADKTTIDEFAKAALKKIKRAKRRERPRLPGA